MSDPSVALQSAVVARLKSHASVTALVSDRVYDEVPTAATYPYINISGGQVIGDDDDCGDGSEVTLQLHAWAQPPSAGAKVKQIAGAIRTAMRAPLVITGFENLLQDFSQAQWLEEPDGKIRHAVIEFRFIIAHP
ncbi:DUF3168 domain-containing protein [Tardiphaga sp. 367_B4_N1_1]|uniref:DUF3168 domain-containing protein n=1 Tax=Tardiphaga sp. 367_B4_N1_1 TaxID=3240777 RepID=UPI003F29E7BC